MEEKKGLPGEKRVEEKLVKCEVWRTGCTEETAKTPIVLIHNDYNKRKVFLPGQAVELTRAQIQLLRDAVYESEFILGPDHPAYSSIDPLGVAERDMPGYHAKKNNFTGEITLHKKQPRYAISILED